MYCIKKQCAVFFVNCLLFASIIQARELFGSLKGIVTDNRTKQPVAGAVVTLYSLPETDTTGEDGAFSFDSIPVGYHDIEACAPEYRTQIFPSVVIKSGVNKECVLEIERSESIQELEKMVVAGKQVVAKSGDQTNSTIKLSRDEVLNSPGATGDVNRVIQLMPAVVGDVDGGFTNFLVRGGDMFENSFLIDGIEVKNLSHWGTEFTSGGAISTLNTDFINDLDFYAGGVPAQFPPQLSSITDIHFRDGSKTDRKFLVDMSIAGFGLSGEGPIVKGKSSYLVNARVSFLDMMEPFLDLGGMPKYQNGQAKVVWDINDRDKIVTNLLVGHETIDIANEETNETIEDEGKHVTGGLYWMRKGERGINTLLFSGKYNDFVETGFREDSIRTWEWDSNDKTFQLKDDVTFFLREQDAASFGFVVERKEDRQIHGNDFYYICVDPDSAYHFYLHRPENFLMLIDSVDAMDLRESETGFRIGGYANYTLFLKNLKINCGMRNDYFTLSKKHGPSPRAGFLLDLNRAGTVSLSGGLYYQFPAYIFYIDDTVSLWDVELQRNYQVVAGYEKQLSDVVVFGSEVYYKYYDREPLYSIVPDITNSLTGERVIDVSPDHYGRKKAYGLELYLHKKKLDKFYYQVSYSLFNARRLYEDGEWYDDDYNLRNNLKTIVGSNFHKCHRVSLRMDLSEGNPYTSIDEDASDIYKRTLYKIEDGWNTKRRTMRAKFSIRYDATLYRKWGNITGYFEVQNILNQRDVYYEYYSLGKYFPKGKVEEILTRGIFPIGGCTIDF